MRMAISLELNAEWGMSNYDHILLRFPEFNLGYATRSLLGQVHGFIFLQTPDQRPGFRFIIPFFSGFATMSKLNLTIATPLLIKGHSDST